MIKLLTNIILSPNLQAAIEPTVGSVFIAPANSSESQPTILQRDLLGILGGPVQEVKRTMMGGGNFDSEHFQKESFLFSLAFQDNRVRGF